MKQQEYWDKMAKHGSEAAVIDPNDKTGYKNEYIMKLRDCSILNALEQPRSAKILDFGCGSGNLSELLSKKGYDVVGVDISRKLLEYAKQKQQDYRWEVIHYDGNKLPFDDGAVDAIVTYGVLIYLMEDNHFLKTMKELHRVLKPGGQFIPVEQATRRITISPDKSKKQRPINDFIDKFQKSGFSVQSHRIIRRGHFLPLYAMRYGLLPRSSYRFFSKIESAIGSIIRTPIMDYVDVEFKLIKK
jgi:ubiquinone/menaquinone biosynthesis C-methylase UbiE